MNYMLDTSVFNWLREGRVTWEAVPKDGDLFVTHIQRDELAQTKDPFIRKLLDTALRVIGPLEVPAEGGVASDHSVASRVGRFALGNETLIKSIRKEMGGNDPLKHSCDALIAATAITKKFTLVTADKTQAQVAMAHGCVVVLWTESI